MICRTKNLLFVSDCANVVSGVSFLAFYYYGLECGFWQYFGFLSVLINIIIIVVVSRSSL